MIKSDVADIKNVGIGRAAGTITAAAFFEKVQLKIHHGHIWILQVLHGLKEQLQKKNHTIQKGDYRFWSKIDFRLFTKIIKSITSTISIRCTNIWISPSMFFPFI
jgi:Leucyl aminopeptidase